MVEVIRGALDPATADGVRALARTAQEHDGVEALGEQTLLQLTGDVTHLLVREDDRVVGYAQLDRGSAELVVAPDARRRGLGRALLTAVRDAAAGEPVSAWAHGDLAAARALASSAGLAVVRELVQMARDLGPQDAPAVPPVPDGTTARAFVVGQDEEAWLRLNARAFADHPEQGRMTRADLEAREREPWFRADDLLLLEQDGEPVAFVWTKVEPGSTDGELYVLAVSPDAQGQGLGRLLTAWTLDHLRARGCARVLLYTEATNTAALATYRRAGFAVSRVDVQYR